MMVATEISCEVQALIDARLDTIDRMLVGRVPRAERLGIVREVEAQIHDVLDEHGLDEPTREDVLAVLARLDPPEAYLPEASEVPRPSVGARAAAPRSRPGLVARPRPRPSSGPRGC